MDLFEGMSIKKTPPRDSSPPGEVDTPSSAFSFMSPSAEPEPPARSGAESTAEAGPADAAATPNGVKAAAGGMEKLALVSPEPQKAAAGISLGVSSTAAARSRVKKRRAKRVGYAREQAMEDLRAEPPSEPGEEPLELPAPSAMRSETPPAMRSETPPAQAPAPAAPVPAQEKANGGGVLSFLTRGAELVKAAVGAAPEPAAPATLTSAPAAPRESAAPVAPAPAGAAAGAASEPASEPEAAPEAAPPRASSPASAAEEGPTAPAAAAAAVPSKVQTSAAREASPPPVVPPPRDGTPPSAAAQLSEAAAAAALDPLEAAEDEMASVGASFLASAGALCAEIRRIAGDAAAAASRVDALAAEASECAAQARRREAEQSSLADAEDYEGADALTAVIEALERRRSDAAAEKTSAEASLAGLLERRPAAFSELRALVGELRDRLRALSSRGEALAARSSGEALAALEKASRQLSSEEERLDLAESHLERRERTVLEEQEAAEEQIAAQTEGILGERRAAAEALFACDGEIAELKRQLALKEAERAAIVADVDRMDADIEAVKAKFDRQLQRIAQDRRGLEDYRSECRAEREQLERDQNAHGERRDAVLGLQARLGGLAKRAAADLGAAGALDRTLSLAEHRKRPSDGGGDGAAAPEDGVAALRAAVADAEESLREAEALRASCEQRRGALAGELEAIAAKAPEIEAQKKAAAARRDFKEASQLSKEAKMLSQRAEAAEAELSAAAAEGDALAPRLGSARERVDGARAALLEGERRMQSGRYEEIQGAVWDLQREKRAAIRGVGEEMSEALRAAVDLVYEAQMAEWSVAAEELQRRFGFEDLDMEGVGEEGEEAEGGAVEEEEEEEQQQQEEEGSEEKEAGEAEERTGEEEGGGATAEGEEEVDERGEDGEGEGSAQGSAAGSACGEAEAEEDRAAIVEEGRRLAAEADELARRVDAAVEAEDFDAAAELEPLREEKGEALAAFLVLHGLSRADVE